MTTINRNIKHLFIGLMTSALFIYPVFSIDYNALGFAEYSKIAVAILFIYFPVNWIMTYKYLQVDKNSVTLRKSIFRRLVFTADQVDFISLQYGPFSSSYFSMNDGSKIKFDAWSIPQKDMDKLKLITSNIK